MAKVIIDGRELELPAGQRLNAIEAGRGAGVEIPHYCYHPGLSIAGNCRMCLVEVGTRDAKTGQVKMQPRLVPGCNLQVTDGMVIVTASEKVRQARAMVEEDLLVRHPIDCPICDKAGECTLQDYYFKYGRDSRRTDLQPSTSRRRDLGDVTLFVDRCVLCTRCVRFCAEVSGTHELMLSGRGAREEIDVFEGHPLHNNLSGNVVDICPVGALCDKDFLYRQRVWFLRRHPAVCTGCSVGCSIWIDENQDRIYRLKPRENPEVNRWWMCNEGRYGYHHVHDARRLLEPRRRDGDATASVEWTSLVEELKEQLRKAGRLGGVLSPYLSVEEAAMLAWLLRSIDPQAILAMGPTPTVGDDQRFPGRFVVAAQKAPNRRGVEEVLAHFTHRVMPLDEFVAGLDRAGLGGVWISGGYRGDWIDEATAQRFDRVPLRIVQDLFPSPLSQRATYALPGAAAAERDGSYVNRGDRLQTSRRGVRPYWGVRPEGNLLWQLLGRKGLYDYRAILDDLSREVAYFAVAAAPIPDTGIDLKLNRLADQNTEPEKDA